MTDEELNARFDGLQASFEASIKAEGIVTRRHFDVVAEALKDEIKLIADGHAAVRDDVAVLKLGQHRLEAGQMRLEVRQLALEHRQGNLEERQERLEERQGNLEGRQETLEGRLGELVEGQQALVTEVRLLAARLPA